MTTSYYKPQTVAPQYTSSAQPGYTDAWNKLSSDFQNALSGNTIKPGQRVGFGNGAYFENQGQGLKLFDPNVGKAVNVADYSPQTLANLSPELNALWKTQYGLDTAGMIRPSESQYGIGLSPLSYQKPGDQQVLSYLGYQQQPGGLRTSGTVNDIGKLTASPLPPQFSPMPRPQQQRTYMSEDVQWDPTNPNTPGFGMPSRNTTPFMQTLKTNSGALSQFKNALAANNYGSNPGSQQRTQYNTFGGNPYYAQRGLLNY